LTATFVLVSVVSMVVLAATLVIAVGHQLRRQALDEGMRTAQAYVGAGVRQAVPEQVFTDGRMTDKGRQELDRALARPAQGLLAVRLWTADGQLIYDSLGSDLTGGFPGGERLDAAVLQDRARAAVIDDLQAPEAGRTGTPERTVLDVYVPVRYGEGGSPVGAAEVMLDYAPTSSRVSDATQTVALLVLGGFALLWLLLFRTVRGASRRLHHSARENARLALLDPLTGLPNRRLMGERLAQAVDASKDGEGKVALLLLDVDRFKEINDTLGHDHGDALLIQVANRLKEVVRSSDTVARLGGDEFAVLLPRVSSLADAEGFAQRVLGIFAQPYELDDMPLHVDTSIGLALLPDHASDVTSLLRGADVAMYTAKASRRGYAVYSADGDDHSPARLVLLGDLRRALDVEDQLCMYYQPKVDLSRGRVVGLEALLRWQHPARGLLLPADFIPLAEQTGLMHRLTRHVLRLVAEQLDEWSRAGIAVPVAVNLSALNLDEDDLADALQALIRDHDVPEASWSWRSRRPRSLPTRPVPSTCCGGSRRPGSALPSTTSAAATPRSPSCVTCPCKP
jgi:diguanylate cyclase (GGDEF)-like protein